MNLLENSQILKRAHRSIFNEIIKKYNTNTVELKILAYLTINKDINNTATNIVENLMITKSYVSKSVESMLKKGWITKYVNPSNRKIMYLKTTNDALPLIQECEKLNTKFFKILSKDITKEENEIMELCLEKINKNIKEFINSRI